jgi:DNA-directed RNA polymerase specialized sigma24 family protein
VTPRNQLEPPRASGRRSARRGRASALPPFQHLIEEHGPALLRFCAAQAAPERAEDVFQETMLAALRAYDEVRDTGSLQTSEAAARRNVFEALKRLRTDLEPTPKGTS